MSGFTPFSTPAGADKAMQGTGQLQGLPEMAPGAANVGRYGGIFKPYRTGGIARGRNAGYPAILHGTEAVVPLGQGKSAIPVEFTGRGGQNQNNVTVNVSMASDGTAQTQTQTNPNPIMAGRLPVCSSELAPVTIFCLLYTSPSPRDS